MTGNGWEVDLESEYITGSTRISKQKQKLTFIRAFESSPVHCLYPRPSGKRRSPGNGGAAAILS